VEKPVVFFSHSSKDSEALKRLKDRFVELTADTIEVFLSSDGQSIRLGKNWLARVEEALKGAKVMFVFLTPNSMASPWVYFESGHAYAKGTDVIPIGLFGVDVGKIPPPLSTLQGFNAVSHDSLNNIIAKVNELFTSKFKMGFTPEDFQALEINSGDARRVLGKHFSAVSDVRFSAIAPKETEPLIQQAFEALPQPKYGTGVELHVPGVTFTAQEFASGFAVNASVDPYFAHEAIKVVDSTFRTFKTTREADGRLGFDAEVWFDSSVLGQWRHHAIMARLYRTEAMAHDEHQDGPRYKWRSLYFRITETFPSRNEPTEQVLKLDCIGESFSGASIGGLIDMLFDCGVYSYAKD
jgi:hypothetical protein